MSEPWKPPTPRQAARILRRRAALVRAMRRDVALFLRIVRGKGGA